MGPQEHDSIVVSVIIPNYNHAPYLQQRIESVLNQTFNSFEVIILDDCSTDESRVIIDQYRGQAKIAVIHYNSQNSGSPFRQWEKGIQIAKGKYVWIAESDDFASRDFLEQLVEKLDRGFDVAYCRSNVVNEGGKVDNGYYWADSLDKDRWNSDYSSDGVSEISKYLIYRNTIPNASACLFRKNHFALPEEVLTMKYCGDWLFWAHFLKGSRLYFVSSALNYHRRHSQSTRGLKDQRSEIWRLREYWNVIGEARKISNKGRIERAEVQNYYWIFEEMFQRRRVLGWRGIFGSLPGSICPFFLVFFVKKCACRVLSL